MYEEFCKDLREHAMKIINYEKKRMVPLTTKEEICYDKQKICYICKKGFNNNGKKQQKVKDHCHYTGKYRGAAHNICSLRYKVLKEIPIVFHNGSTYDYHFITKESVKEFDGNFDCLGENTEKYITFLVPLKIKILKLIIKKNLLIVSDLCHHHYLNLFIIYLKGFIIINVLIVNLISITCVLLKIKKLF